MSKDEKKNNVLMTPSARIAFPQVWRPKAFAEGQAENFSVIAIFYPDNFTEAERKQYKKMIKVCNAESKAKFGKEMKALPSTAGRPITNGEEKGELLGFGEGSVFATLKSRYKPSVVDKHGEEITDESLVYPGVWARFTVTPYAYSGTFGKGVKLGLRNIQILKDDERFDGRTNGGQDFAGVDVDDRFLDEDDDTFDEDDDFDDDDE